MKKTLSTILLLAAITCTSFANKQNLVYDKTVNPTIGITIGNISTPTPFSVKDKNGTIIRKGIVHNGSTINIDTRGLKAGTYYFEILGEVKKFIIE